MAQRKWQLCSCVDASTVFKVLENIVSDCFVVLFQTCTRDPPRYPKHVNNYKKQPPHGIDFPGIALWVLELRWWFQNSFSLRPGASESYSTAQKWSHNTIQGLQYHAINIESNTALTTLWNPAQTHLCVPLAELVPRSGLPKQFLSAAGWRETYIQKKRKPIYIYIYIIYILCILNI